MPENDMDVVEIELDEEVVAQKEEPSVEGGEQSMGLASIFDDVDLAMVPFVQEDEDEVPDAEEVNVESMHSTSGLQQSVKRKSSELDKTTEYTATKAAFHIFKGNVGAAIFSLASAYVKAGYIMGTIILTVLAVICVHCMLLLVQCKQTINDPSVQTYGQVACAAFGRRGKHLVDVFVVITQLGFCCVYFQFAAGMLHNVVPGVSVTAWVLAMVPIAVFLTFLPNMKKLIPAAIFATFATLLSLVILYGFSFSKLASDGLDESVSPAASIWTMPVCLGNTISAFEGIGLVLPIENPVRDKAAFPNLLIVTFVFISLLYVSFGLVGYLAYSASLTNSITDVTPDGWLSGVVRLGMAVAILLTYPLQFFPAAQIIEGWMFERKFRYQALQPSFRSTILFKDKFMLVWHNLSIRVVISIALALLAILVGDQMSLFLALIGGMGGSALAVILPPLLHLKIIVFGKNANQYSRYTNLVIVKDCLVFIFGVMGGCFSTYFSLLELLQSFKGGEETAMVPKEQPVISLSAPVPFRVY